MELCKNSRLAVGSFIVTRQLNKFYRIKKFNSLRNAHKIGIVWDGSNINDFKAITAFYMEMQGKGIQVDIVCYYPGKILPDEYTALRYMTCYKRGDLNLFFIPHILELDEFIATPYEILIDINFNNYFPLYYVSALSKAEFKIGAGKTINHNTLDMTIEIANKKDISYYIEQVRYYLEMINTGV